MLEPHQLRIIYGTAWKKDRTEDLVTMALRAGFRAIDTATQPKHYYQPGVGKAMQKAYTTLGLNRQDLFIQTKFTSLDGQDLSQPLPYNRSSALSDQVKQSLATSLKELQTDYIDSLVMHSPMHTMEDTLEVWRCFENFVAEKKVRFIGISNLYDAAVFQQLVDRARIKPTFIQNRFYQQTGYDKQIRQICNTDSIVYQAFWTLTANPHVLRSPELKSIAQKLDLTSPQVFFRFLMDEGIAPLSGTTDATHAEQDIAVTSLPTLDDQDRRQIRQLVDALDAQAVLKYNQRQAVIPAGSIPALCPPILEDESLVISQTPNILLYLGQKLGLAGTKQSDVYAINGLALSCLDLNNEAHNTHHPVATNLAYEEQQPEAARTADNFRKIRLPKFLTYFEAVLDSNPTKSGTLYGPEITYADLVLFQLVDGLQFAFPKAMASLAKSGNIDRILALQQRLATETRLKEYLRSSRRQKYSNGIFRYYPELDDE